MNDPAEEFRKLAGVIADLRKEINQALAEKRPDYGQDLRQIFTVMEKIEGKDILKLSSWDVQSAADRGTNKGTDASCREMREAVTKLGHACRTIGQACNHVEDKEVNITSLKLKIKSLKTWLMIAGLVFIIMASILVGMMIGIRAMPNRMLATGAGCSLAGGQYYAHPHDGPSCTFWATP